MAADHALRLRGVLLLSVGVGPYLGVSRRSLTSSSSWKDRLINNVSFAYMTLILSRFMVPAIFPNLPGSGSPDLNFAIRIGGALGLLFATHALLEPLQPFAVWLHGLFKVESDVHEEERSETLKREDGEVTEKSDEQKKKDEEQKAKKHTRELHFLESLLGSLVLLIVWWMTSYVNKNIESPLQLCKFGLHGRSPYTPTLLLVFPASFLLDLGADELSTLFRWRRNKELFSSASTFQWYRGVVPAVVESILVIPYLMLMRALFLTLREIIGYWRGLAFISLVMMAPDPSYRDCVPLCNALVQRCIRVCHSGGKMEQDIRGRFRRQGPAEVKQQ